MDELTEAIAQKTGLPEAKARQAAEVAVNFIKARLPQPMATQVEAVLQGGKLAGAEDALKGLSNFPGGQKS